LGHRSACKYLSTRPHALGASHDGCRSSGCARRREKRAASGERHGQQSETDSDLAQGHGGRRVPLGLEGSARDGRTMPASTAVARDGALTRFRKQPVQYQSRAMNTAAQLHRAGRASAHEKGVEGVGWFGCARKKNSAGHFVSCVHRGKQQHCLGPHETLSFTSIIGLESARVNSIMSLTPATRYAAFWYPRMMHGWLGG
jgi:hypothetical protein